MESSSPSSLSSSSVVGDGGGDGGESVVGDGGGDGGCGGVVGDGGGDGGAYEHTG